MPPIFKGAFASKEGVDKNIAAYIQQAYNETDQDTEIYFTGITAETASYVVSTLQKQTGHYIWSYLDFGYFVLYKNDAVYGNMKPRY